MSDIKRVIIFQKKLKETEILRKDNETKNQSSTNSLESKEEDFNEEKQNNFDMLIVTAYTRGISCCYYIPDCMQRPVYYYNEGDFDINRVNIVLYEDYLYYYNMEKDENNRWRENKIEGWSAVVIDKDKSNYSPICSYIFGKPVVSLAYTFNECVKMESAPNTPSTIKYMESTFKRCESLKKAPNIPSNIEILDYTFSNCSNLSGNIKIDSNKLTSFTRCFYLTNGKITLNGNSKYLYQIANTCSFNNVSVK